MLTYYYWPVPAGGAENQCRRLANVLAARGHQCLILTCRSRSADAKQEEENGVAIVRIFSLELFIHLLQSLIDKKKVSSQQAEEQDSYSSSAADDQPVFCKSNISNVINFCIRFCNISAFSFAVLFFLLRKRRSFDVLHVHTAEWIAGLAAFAGKIFKLPVICKGADMPVFPPLQAVPLADCCDRWRRRPHFIALTPAMKDDLMRNTVPESNITIISNGVPIPAQTAPVENNSHFLYIGNFSQTAAHKAFDVLLEGWAVFHYQRPSSRLLLLGGGAAEPWQALARQLGCADSMDFLGYQTSLTPFFEQTCCLLLPSRKEGIANALLEAQSWGIPAITSDIPGNRAVVEHQKNGLIVPVGDSNALAQAMLRLHDSPELRKEYGAAARKRMEDVFALDKVADQTVALYQQVAG
jgi:glycosyltransferase involved in cell wall biosynthesis